MPVHDLARYVAARTIRTYTVSGAAIQTYDFPDNLGAFQTGILQLSVRLKTAVETDGVIYKLRLNGNDVAYDNVQTIQARSTAATAATTWTNLLTSYDSAYGLDAMFQIPCGLTLDRQVLAFVRSGYADATRPEKIEGSFRLITPATGAQLTSIGFGADTAGAIAVGTEMSLVWAP